MNTIANAGNRGGSIRSDCFVSLKLASGGGIRMKLQSRVDRLFGDQIRSQVTSQLAHHGIAHGRIELEDSGALPFVIAARVEAAVRKLMPDAPSWLPPVSPAATSGEEKSGLSRHRISRLYIPGNTPKLMLNPAIYAPDGIILDLEDSVAPGKKLEARILVRNALRQVDFGGSERMVRINQLPEGLDDLAEVVAHRVETVLIPKCEHPGQVTEVDRKIQSILRAGSSSRNVFLMPIIESCLGIEHAFGIASSCSSVAAVAIGLEDYTADLGVPRTDTGEESFFARARLVNACKAAGIQPVDSVFSDVDDTEGLLVTATRSRSLGFEGMGCIHPRQVAVIHRGFAPSEEEIDRAGKIIDAFREAESRGEGVVALGSKMIDPPVVKRAIRTMELARRFGPERGSGE